MSRIFWRVRIVVLLGLVNGCTTLLYAQSPPTDTSPTRQASTEKSIQNSQDSANDNSLQAKVDLSYKSVFDNYIPYDQTPEISWKEANDLVGHIGGWRSYGHMVQEAQEKERQRKKADQGDQ